ncbi:O-antigen ligase family protein, partial [Candidatus Pelagibacter sp.]|nr:O-antigen ligase family protein [Candidatus Pelagibacter sp.]
LFILTIISSNEKYEKRFFNQFLKIYTKNPIENIINSEHGGHYLTALKIFSNNIYFGVGLKNYNKEIQKKEYKEFFYYKSINPSTHPHQIHFELLAELGLFGYFSFAVFFIYHFIKFFRNKSNNDYVNLAGLLFVVTSLLPILPSGSFFTSHGATFFWINFSIMSLNYEIDYFK